MKLTTQIPASVLPTVLVVSVVMMLLVLGLLALWDFNFLMFSRSDYVRKQRANIESLFLLYKNDPEKVSSAMGEDSVFRLYEEDHSGMKLAVSPWGLYEAVTVTSLCGKVSATRLLGLEGTDEKYPALWYADAGSALTVTGKTEIQGYVAAPRNGIIYGQMQSVFFSGKEVSREMISISHDSIPQGSPESLDIIGEIFMVSENPSGFAPGENVEADFNTNKPEVVFITDELPYGCSYRGMVIICADRITVRKDCRLKDVLLVANYIEVDDGVAGSFQSFVRDSVVVGKDVVLDFPSGIYSENRIRIGDNSVINGYVINNFEGQTEVMEPNTVKSRTSKVRGLLYCRGISVVQGITTGSAYIEESFYFSPHGYYRNMLFDAAFLENESIAYPLWLAREGRREEVAWER